ncbi:2-hydroxyacid dehydrogenase [Aeromicrobium sp. Leaf350]|uniref:2-hydroxyacid dehydrogenase n=1 Tax=Aeromicrobium sp. Leaf350 TaxID=2876565 RepID=UPI001E29D9D0|nr:2-hydroxyacid dehydrogenase [Aeromicrobium sp. Leaf350]
MSSPVLLAHPLQADLAADLVRLHDAVSDPSDGVRVAVTTSRFGLSADEVAALPALEAIVSFGVGYDSIDLEAVRSRGIQVATTPGVLTDAVADLAVGLLIDTVRQVSASDRYVRGGRWAADGNYPLTGQVTGRKVGIVGLGRIGHAIADRLAGFRCEIGYHNRSVADVPYAYHSSVAELAAWADVLVLAAPGGGDPVVGANELAALGAEGHVVNIGRGSLVDEPALIAALTDGTIAGAGLDVFADEPHVPEALRALDNVVLVPHVGSGTRETRRAMADLVLANVDAFLERGELVTPLS